MASSSSSSIHTVEGNVAGSRAAQLERKRLQDLEEFEQRKRQIHDDGAHSIVPIGQKFAAASTTREESNFRSQTVGLVSSADFARAAKASADASSSSYASKSKRNSALEAPGSATANGDDDNGEEGGGRNKDSKAEKKARKARLKEKKRLMSTLSFANEDDIPIVDDANNNNNNNNNEAAVCLPASAEPPSPAASAATAPRRRRIQKDDTVDTSFLPDPERDEKLRQEKLRLEQEWHTQQEVVKKERLEITYSYWDGSGHRRTVTVQKGSTVGEFLELVRRDLCTEFRELVNVSSDALLYVKEDLIIPSDMTFYDLIVTKARGKSGPLFHFDVHDDVRIGALDARIEKDESHPGKVVERRWYDRNRHIFPASRWEVYDPAVEYGSYTIGDRNAGGRMDGS
jgi:protein FAM50